jgi:hypothetical protein
MKTNIFIYSALTECIVIKSGERGVGEEMVAWNLEKPECQKCLEKLKAWKQKDSSKLDKVTD